ncbi:PREDICTED: uncharacterized protein LOC105143778 [Acromyrmex echinatior]|uniref:uncharacterized protein LOC105143778 n=1 Tax=Acromyrmex echinatior TaxID=103372 RepID=UPI00058109E2|nr:PREDICTED: uncharacterized protein LOC105143778 [Acromyrmex echinatior]
MSITHKQTAHGVEHVIETTSPPVSNKARRLCPEKLKTAKQEFEYMMQQDLNLVRTYQQISVRESDIPKTVIITPFELFEFPYMTFGLRNAAQTFQRFMDWVTVGLDFCFIYIDILIASQDETQHKELQQHSIAINPNKCVFGQKSVSFLGHTISAERIKPLPKKVQAIVEFQEPATVKGLRCFLGMLNFYNRFLKDLASMQAPLLNAISGRKQCNNNAKIEWTPELKQSFQRVKEHFAQATSLAFPDSKATLSLQTDASDKAIGAVLQQYSNGFLQPVSFFSRKLTPTQIKYSIYDRKLLAIYAAIKHFRYMLERRNFHVITDHKPLVYAFKSSQPMHVSGAENIVADALSRVDTVVMPTSLDIQEIAKAQASDNELQQLKQSTSIFEAQKCIKCLIQAAEHQQTAQKFVWPSMAKNIKEWARMSACQQSKIHRHNHTSPTKIPIPDTRFEYEHIDIVGPLPSSKANTVAKMFFTHQIWSSTPDQSSQFEAQLFNTLTKLVGSKRCRTTAYHPKSNGIIERWHRFLKTALMCHGETQWTDTLPVILLGLRICFKEDSRHFCSGINLRHYAQSTVEGSRRSLDQPYTGPHKVLERISNKVFATEVDGKCINATVNRLKLAYLIIQDSETISSTAFPSSINIPVQYEPKTYPATKRKTVRFKD